MVNLMSYVLVSTVNLVSRVVEYSIVLEEWIDRVAGSFKYPPVSEKKYVFRYLKNHLLAQDHWDKFVYRKIHHDKIGTVFMVIMYAYFFPTIHK